MTKMGYFKEASNAQIEVLNWKKPSNEDLDILLDNILLFNEDQERDDDEETEYIALKNNIVDRTIFWAALAVYHLNRDYEDFLDTLSRESPYFTSMIKSMGQIELNSLFSKCLKLSEDDELKRSHRIRIEEIASQLKTCLAIGNNSEEAQLLMKELIELQTVEESLNTSQHNNSAMTSISTSNFKDNFENYGIIHSQNQASIKQGVFNKYDEDYNHAIDHINKINDNLTSEEVIMAQQIRRLSSKMLYEIESSDISINTPPESLLLFQVVALIIKHLNLNPDLTIHEVIRIASLKLGMTDDDAVEDDATNSTISVSEAQIGSTSKRNRTTIRQKLNQILREVQSS